MRSWQSGTQQPPALSGWVGRLGFGATLVGDLNQLRLDVRGVFSHPQRAALHTSQQLLHKMEHASAPDLTLFRTYLASYLDDATISTVMLPLLRAYQRDPDLLRRYNYGRGKWGQPVTPVDQQRIDRARAWLHTLAEQIGRASCRERV